MTYQEAEQLSLVNEHLLGTSLYPDYWFPILAFMIAPKGAHIEDLKEWKKYNGDSRAWLKATYPLEQDLEVYAVLNDKGVSTFMPLNDAVNEQKSPGRNPGL
jgi:hypothetical protein